MTPKENAAIDIYRKNYKHLTENVSDEMILHKIKLTWGEMLQMWDAALDWAAENAEMKFLDGTTKQVHDRLKYFQSGADNLTINKQSILKGKE